MFFVFLCQTGIGRKQNRESMSRDEERLTLELRKSDYYRQRGTPIILMVGEISVCEVSKTVIRSFLRKKWSILRPYVRVTIPDLSTRLSSKSRTSLKYKLCLCLSFVLYPLHSSLLSILCLC